jgi:hypothetical protein
MREKIMPEKTEWHKVADKDILDDNSCPYRCPSD